MTFDPSYLKRVVAILKRRFPNLTTEQTVEIAVEIVGEAPK